MNIGIDIDGVLTNVGKFIIEEGQKYCEENQKGKLLKTDVLDTKEVFGWDNETDVDFWLKNIFIYAKENPIIEGAAENIKKLKQDGHHIYIITARFLTTEETQERFKDIYKNDGEDMRELVKKWLAENNIIYDKIIFSGEDKSKHIHENKIDIMIEDTPSNLENLSKITKMICYDWPYNKCVKNNNIHRCHNWDEIYKTIKESQDL